jgi:hypothetical protein
MSWSDVRDVAVFVPSQHPPWSHNDDLLRHTRVPEPAYLPYLVGGWMPSERFQNTFAM